MNIFSKSTYYKYFLKSAPNVLMYKLFKKKWNLTKFAGKKGITMEYSSDIIKDAIVNNKPFCAVRFGAVELSCWNNYHKIELGIKKKYKDPVTYSIKNNAGVFPTNKETLDTYSKLCLDNLKNIDVLAISGLHMEEYYYKGYCNDIDVIQNWALEPLLGEWTPLLKNKRVLVISPFAKQIENQYRLKDKLFNDKNILPDFKELHVIEAVQTIADELDPRFNNWFEALDYMKKEINKLEFDIALIGCGAYGLPLAVHIKELGKIALQSGGATQTLFGIIGKRWEKRDHVKKHINEFWARPEKKPKNLNKVESGAYW